jgi:secreted Zn-dependent insulinase-like peptidase
MNLTVSILGNDFFNKLRTIKQLGYLVNLSFISYNNDYYIIQKIQSNKDIKIIKKEINKFNKKIIKKINKINLDIYITKLKKELLEPDYNLNSKYSKYLVEILTRNYLFYKIETLLNYINNINKEDLINFINLIINKKNRIKIIIL